jgi:hypothetical protein
LSDPDPDPVWDFLLPDWDAREELRLPDAFPVGLLLSGDDMLESDPLALDAFGGSLGSSGSKNVYMSSS